jgi:porin
LTASGVTLAEPTSGGTPAMLRGDFGIYAVFEQKLYRVAGDDDRGIGSFARASYSPPDRNLIDCYADAGLEFVGLSDQRPKDKLGIAAAYAHVSPWTRALDTDFRNLSEPGWPIRRFEGLFTAVYQYEIRAGWTLTEVPTKGDSGSQVRRITKGCWPPSWQRSPPLGARK